MPHFVEVQPKLSRQSLQERFTTGNIDQIEEAINEVILALLEENPNVDIQFYRNLANKLPYHVRKETQTTVKEAINSEDPEISAKGKRAFTFIYLKSILAAAEEYLGDESTEEDLLQIALETTMAKVLDLANTSGAPTSIRLNKFIKTALESQIAVERGLPVSFVQERLHSKIENLVAEYILKFPLGLSQENIDELASRLSLENSASYRHLKSYIREKDTQLLTDQVVDDEDMLDFRIRVDLEDEFEKALKYLTDREREMLQNRFWFGLTQAETKKRMRVSANRVKELEHDTLFKLKSGTPLSNSLRAYSKPYEAKVTLTEKFPQQEPEATHFEREVYLPGLGISINSNLLNYRYSQIRLGYGEWVSPRFGPLHLDYGIQRALFSNGIHNLSTLLTANYSVWQKISGYNTERMHSLRKSLIVYLYNDSTMISSPTWKPIV